MGHRHSISRPTRAVSIACRPGRYLACVVAGFAMLGAAAADRTGPDVVKAQCGQCHDSGKSNAPRVGDKDAWVPRFRLGVEHLVDVAIRGHGGMPPRGGRADLKDSEIRAALLHMFNPAGPPKDPMPASRSAAPPGAGPHRVSVAGLDVYLGRVSAERMREFPPGSPEAQLHAGIPSGTGYHHINVSVYDSARQEAVTGATVDLEYEQVGMGRQARTLEPVTIRGGPSYGGYIRLVPKANYVFVVRVRKTGAAQPVDARFQERVN